MVENMLLPREIKVVLTPLGNNKEKAVSFGGYDEMKHHPSISFEYSAGMDCFSDSARLAITNPTEEIVAITTYLTTVSVYVGKANTLIANGQISYFVYDQNEVDKKLIIDFSSYYANLSLSYPESYAGEFSIVEAIKSQANKLGVPLSIENYKDAKGKNITREFTNQPMNVDSGATIIQRLASYLLYLSLDIEARMVVWTDFKGLHVKRLPDAYEQKVNEIGCLLITYPTFSQPVSFVPQRKEYLEASLSSAVRNIAVTQLFTKVVCWFNPSIQVGNMIKINYENKQGKQESVSGLVESLKHQLDVNTGDKWLTSISLRQRASTKQEVYWKDGQIQVKEV